MLVRLQPDQLAELDSLIKESGTYVSRPEALRMILLRARDHGIQLPRGRNAR